MREGCTTRLRRLPVALLSHAMSRLLLCRPQLLPTHTQKQTSTAAEQGSNSSKKRAEHRQTQTDTDTQAGRQAASTHECIGADQHRQRTAAAAGWAAQHSTAQAQHRKHRHRRTEWQAEWNRARPWLLLGRIGVDSREVMHRTEISTIAGRFPDLARSRFLDLVRSYY